jgi:hypothetical protein
MSAPSPPGKEQYGGVLAGVKAKPYGWPTASLDTGSGHHPPAAARGAAGNKITTSQVSTESGEPRTPSAQTLDDMGVREICFRSSRRSR